MYDKTVFLLQPDMDEPEYAQVTDAMKVMSLKGDHSSVPKIGPHPHIKPGMRPARSAEDLPSTLEHKIQKGATTLIKIKILIKTFISGFKVPHFFQVSIFYQITVRICYWQSVSEPLASFS